MKNPKKWAVRSLPLALVVALSPSAARSQAAGAPTVKALQEGRKPAEALALAEKSEPTVENDFHAARAVRDLGRHEEARERYLKFLRQHPSAEQAADAAIEAALMLIAPLDQVAHDDAERALAAQVAAEIEGIAATHAAKPATLARASYTAGNTWRIAERDAEAEAAYDRSRATGDPDYVPKALLMQAELALRRLQPERSHKLLQECVTKHPATSAARAAARTLERVAVVGKPAPEFQTETWVKGPPVTREALAGRVTLVFAFTTTCPHCRREMPHAATLLAQHGSRGLQVIGLTAHRKEQTTAQVQAFVADPHQAITYPVAVDLEERTTTAMQLEGLPSAALIDRAGIVRWVGHPNYMSRALVETLLAAPAPAG